MVTAVCSPENDGGVVTIDGWNTRSWKRVAHAEFQLPDTALVARGPDTALKELCVPAGAKEVIAIRSLFDQDFTRMAVVTEDPQARATHVGYVDRSGKFTDLTGNEGFGNTPNEENAVFSPDGSAVWFSHEVVHRAGCDTRDSIASRALAWDHSAVDHGQVDSVGERNLIIVGTPGSAVVASSAHLSPDMKRVLAGSRLLELPAEGGVVGPDLMEKGSFLSCNGAGQVGWLDDGLVLCDAKYTHEGRFATLDVASGAKPGPPIVPSNDRSNYGMVISPDGQRFAFLSHKGTATDYYLCDTEPGSTPEKVERSGEFSTLGDTAVFIEWR